MTYEEKKAYIKAWKAGMEEVDRITLEEDRNRTPQERMRNHQVFLDRLARMGRLPSRPPQDKFYLRWIEVRKRWDERQARVS